MALHGGVAKPEMPGRFSIAVKRASRLRVTSAGKMHKNTCALLAARGNASSSMPKNVVPSKPLALNTCAMRQIEANVFGSDTSMSGQRSKRLTATAIRAGRSSDMDGLVVNAGGQGNTACVDAHDSANTIATTYTFNMADAGV